MTAGLVQLRKFQGVNLSVEATDLADNELAASMNMYPVKADGGDLAVRFNSRGLIDQLSTLLTEGGKSHLFQFRAGNTHHVLAWEEPGRWFHVGEDDALYEILNTVESSGQKPSTVQWQDKLYLFTGGSAGYVLAYVPTQNPPFTMTSLSGASHWNTSTVRPKVAVVYQGTMMLSGFGGAEESMVRFTEVGDPNTLLTDAKAIYVGRGVGGDVNGMIEVAVEGGSEYIQTYGIVMKPGGMWMMQGTLPTSTSDGDLVVTPINKEQGLVDKATIVETKFGYIWCSGGDVWIAPTGQKPLRIGEQIRPMLEQVPQTPGMWHAVYYGGFYRLTIPRAGASDQYPEVEQWWCDLRNYPARVSWWGPMTVHTNTMLSVGQPGTQQRLLSLANHYNGDGTYSLCLEEQDVSTSNAVDHENGLGESEIEAELRFRNLDLGDPAMKKIIQQVDVTAQLAASGDIMQLSLIRNGGVTTESQAQQPAAETGFILGTSLLGSGSLGNGFRTITFSPPAGERFLAHMFQPVVRLTEVTGYTRIRELALRVRVLGNRPTTRQEET